MGRLEVGYVVEIQKIEQLLYDECVGAARYKRWLLLIVSYHGVAGFGPERHFVVARTRVHAIHFPMPIFRQTPHSTQF